MHVCTHAPGCLLATNAPGLVRLALGAPLCVLSPHLTQSIFICAGKGSMSYWILPKLSDMPRLKLHSQGQGGQ